MSRWYSRRQALYAILSTLCLATACSSSKPVGPVAFQGAFVPFGLCMGGLSPKDQLAYCKRVGFSGLGLAAMDKGLIRSFATLPEVASGLFRIPSVLWWSDVNTVLDSVRLDSILADAHKMDMAIWMVAAGKKREPGALGKAIDKYARVASRCEKAGVRLVLYPHAGTVIETVEESLSVLDSLRHRGHTEVKTSIHLCHELKAGNGGRLEEIVARSAPYLALASISGADSDLLSIKMGGWGSVIKPLDEGSNDPRPFLEALARHGFKGTMELHTYHLKNPSMPDYDNHLERSLKRWQELVGTNTR